MDIGGRSHRGDAWLGVLVAFAVPIVQLCLGLMTHAANVTLPVVATVILLTVGTQVAGVILAVTGVVITGRALGLHGRAAWFGLFVVGVPLAYVAWLVTGLTINVEPWPY